MMRRIETACIPGSRPGGEHIMASEKQIAANQRNARKSTGPRTAQGKARSSKNALRRGLSRQNLAPGETFRAYKAHFATIHAELQPAGPLEKILVRLIADATWRMQRMARIKDAYLAQAAEAAKSEGDHSDPGSDKTAARGETDLFAVAMARRLAELTKLEKTRGSLSDAYRRAYRQLVRIRVAEGKPVVPKRRTPRDDSPVLAFRA
jgi:hypothetical protein